MRVMLLVHLVLLIPAIASSQQESSGWTFAVSGDSRNCGDVVVPAIAEGAKRDEAQFYWHLGDYRAIYDFDQDYKQIHPGSSIADYETGAWQDFIDHQLAPFGELPLYLALGNHETVLPMTRALAIQAFADWWDSPTIKAQRLADNPRNHTLQTYYHWIKLPVDFITLDNGTDDMFDDAQVKWFEDELKSAASNDQIRTVVVGMHRALPDSISTGHSMNDTAQGAASGRRVYHDLVDFRAKTQKNVYVLASHSHFYMSDVYNTACRQQHPDTILPGWIVGTAGAVRYELPDDRSGAKEAQNELYGYLIGRVNRDGAIRFEFRPVERNLNAVPDPVRKLFTDDFVQQCLEKNHSKYKPEGPAKPPNCPE